LGDSEIDQWCYPPLKNLQLFNLIFYRPDKDSLNARRFVGGEFFRANLRRPDEKPFSELIEGRLSSAASVSAKTRSVSALSV
jgi:hypothetical protein